jgi:D-tyrosyl-tRNA(Tyr) deacylase
VREASVTIDGSVHGKIDQGFLLLVGIQDADDEATVRKMAEKISRLRVFEDEAGKMNLSLAQVNGAVLSISQFTLYADCHKGNRPSFDKAGKPDHARKMYAYFNDVLRELGHHVEEGIFAADMKVSLCNDGPVTIVLDSDELFG